MSRASFRKKFAYSHTVTTQPTNTVLREVMKELIHFTSYPIYRYRTTKLNLFLFEPRLPPKIKNAAPVSVEESPEGDEADVPDEVDAAKATAVDPADEPAPVPVVEKKPEEATPVIESEEAVPGEYNRRR